MVSVLLRPVTTTSDEQKESFPSRQVSRRTGDRNPSDVGTYGPVLRRDLASFCPSDVLVLVLVGHGPLRAPDPLDDGSTAHRCSFKHSELIAGRASRHRGREPGANGTMTARVVAPRASGNGRAKNTEAPTCSGPTMPGEAPVGSVLKLNVLPTRQPQGPWYDPPSSVVRSRSRRPSASRRQRAHCCRAALHQHGSNQG